jgi:hypothetical protein
MQSAIVNSEQQLVVELSQRLLCTATSALDKLKIFLSGWHSNTVKKRDR